MHTNSIPTTEQFNGIIFVRRENICHSILYFDKFSSRGGIATDRRSKRNQLNTIPKLQSSKQMFHFGIYVNFVFFFWLWKEQFLYGRKCKVGLLSIQFQKESNTFNVSFLRKVECLWDFSKKWSQLKDGGKVFDRISKT